jgi:hypothetical protein
MAGPKGVQNFDNEQQGTLEEEAFKSSVEVLDLRSSATAPIARKEYTLTSLLTQPNLKSNGITLIHGLKTTQKRLRNLTLYRL